MSGFKEYDQYDGLGLAELVRAGEVSAAELLEEAIARVSRINPKLNAVVHTFEARALQATVDGLPQGPFQGVPFLLKDLVAAFAGEPLSMGSRGLKHFVPDFDSHLVQRFKAAGLNIFGKTNCPELGLVITTESKAHGPAHNPHRHGYSTGGSSGGSCAAVAAGIVPMANADDGGGSIRLPASWCGIIGLKPSRGRNPVGPRYSDMWNGAVAQHMVCRSVRDTAAMLDCTSGAEYGAPYIVQPPSDSFLQATQRDPQALTIAVSRRPLVPGTQISEEVLAQLDQTARSLQSLGHHVEEFEPVIDIEPFWRSFFVVVACHVATEQKNIALEIGRHATRQFEPLTKNMAMIGRSMSARDLLLAKQVWHQAELSMAALFRQYDVMLTPTVPTTAPPHGELMPSFWDEVLLELSSYINVGKLAFAMGMVDRLGLPVLRKMGFTLLANVTGLPAISLPVAMDRSGLPIGMQLTGRMCAEETLLGLSAQLERAGVLQVVSPSSP